jgi:Holliday junction resolvase RusA-like endonuclease
MHTEIIFYGRPATKKNSQQIIYNQATKRRFVMPSKTYQVYEKDCLSQLYGYKGPRFEGRVTVKAVYYLPNLAHWPDLTGLMQATADILEKAKIISNDKNIVSWDGTHIAGVDKDKPRTEIIVEEVKS